MTRRRAILIAVMFSLLCVLIFHSYSHMAKEREKALAAVSDLRECRGMADRIRRLSRRPQVAADQERVSGETTTLIERAARSAGMKTGGILRITPGSPQRIEDTAYKEKPTGVLLKDITLQQLVRLLHAVASGDRRLHPKSLRIAAPRRDNTGPLWTAEIELTYLIYAPLRLDKTRSLQ